MKLWMSIYPLSCRYAQHSRRKESHKTPLYYDCSPLIWEGQHTDGWHRFHRGTYKQVKTWSTNFMGGTFPRSKQPSWGKRFPHSIRSNQKHYLRLMRGLRTSWEDSPNMDLLREWVFRFSTTSWIIKPISISTQQRVVLWAPNILMW